MADHYDQREALCDTGNWPRARQAPAGPAPGYFLLHSLPPADIIAAAEKVSRWFSERNITDWKLGHCQSRGASE